MYEETHKYLVMYEDWRPLVIYDLAPDPFWNFIMYMRKMIFSFLLWKPYRLLPPFPRILPFPIEINNIVWKLADKQLQMCSTNKIDLPQFTPIPFEVGVASWTSESTMR